MKPGDKIAGIRWITREEAEEIYGPAFEEEPPSIHVIKKDGVWWCQCCAAPVPFEHICACET